MKIEISIPELAQTLMNNPTELANLLNRLGTYAPFHPATPPIGIDENLHRMFTGKISGMGKAFIEAMAYGLEHGVIR